MPGSPFAFAYRELDGNILLTDQHISEDSFYDEFETMADVNSTFPRTFETDKSRPKMRKIELGPSALRELRSIFFDPDGSLKEGIAKDVDLTTRHGFINFSNPNCREFRRDQRWQIPIKRHSNRELIGARQIFEDFLSRNGLLDPTREHIHDLGILIGGTGKLGSCRSVSVLLWYL
jgi:hypothetical protein